MNLVGFFVFLIPHDSVCWLVVLLPVSSGFNGDKPGPVSMAPLVQASSLPVGSGFPAGEPPRARASGRSPESLFSERDRA